MKDFYNLSTKVLIWVLLCSSNIHFCFSAEENYYTNSYQTKVWFYLHLFILQRSERSLGVAFLSVCKWITTCTLAEGPQVLRARRVQGEMGLRSPRWKKLLPVLIAISWSQWKQSFHGFPKLKQISTISQYFPFLWQNDPISFMEDDDGISRT